ncbi:hypothetical protein LTR65_006948 [Meristemomyces frigidus]
MTMNTTAGSLSALSVSQDEVVLFALSSPEKAGSWTEVSHIAAAAAIRMRRGAKAHYQTRRTTRAVSKTVIATTTTSFAKWDQEGMAEGADIGRTTTSNHG